MKNKAIFKKWWFWAVVTTVLSCMLVGNSQFQNGLEKGMESTNSSSNQKTDKKQTNNEPKNGIKTHSTGTANSANSPEKSIAFTITDVPNDSTGNWRIAKISEKIEIQNYALDYYKKNFKNDHEIHAIVNFYTKTTTGISVIGNLLDVSIHEYVKKEEHNAKVLFSGKLIKEYHINKDTGEIEVIQ